MTGMRQSFKIHNKRNLPQHGLTLHQYKEKRGFKKNQSSVAKALSRQRRKKMQNIQLWKQRKSAQ